MKFLADMGVSMSTVRSLRDRGHEAIHLREEGLHQLPDEKILEKARQEGRIVLAFDLDFGDLMATGASMFPSVIIFRLHDETPANVTARLFDVLAQRSQELEEGVILVVEDTRYRMRRLPIEELGNKDSWNPPKQGPG
jgi:predicted nuclease of predicted toxin-antitoxin system